MRSNILTLLSVALLVSCRTANDQAEKAMGLFTDSFTVQTVLDEPANDLSAQSRRIALDSLRNRMSRLETIDTTLLSVDRKIDWRFAHSLLYGQLLELERMGYHEKDPRQYMRFAALSSVIAAPGDTARKIKEAADRLRAVPRQLENARLQIRFHVPRFQELALFMAENSLVLFDEELPAFIRGAGPSADVLRQPTLDARASVVAFIEYMKNDLPKLPEGSFALGKEAYNDMLRHQFLMQGSADSLQAFARAAFASTVAELEDLSGKIDSMKSWQEGIEIIRRQTPAPFRMMVSHQRWVDKAREHILFHDLIPIPWKEKVNVVPRAVYLRKTSYYGNFSMARTKDADGSFTSEWMINPPEDGWSKEQLEDYMLEHDWGVIVVTAPHETYGGHHVQGLYQMHNPSRIRRENSVSLFGEGWGLYNEQLMQETGFFPNEKVHLRQLQLRLWRIARVIYDVGLHTGTMTYEEAISLMTEQVGFKRWSAQLEIDAATAAPGYFIGYYTGMAEILRMREDFRKLKGDQYTHREFHERLLKAGSMPPVLMRKALFEGD